MFFLASFPTLCSNVKLQFKQRSCGGALYAPVHFPAALASCEHIAAQLFLLQKCWNTFFESFEKKLPVSCVFTSICFNVLIDEQKLVFHHHDIMKHQGTGHHHDIPLTHSSYWDFSSNSSDYLQNNKLSSVCMHCLWFFCLVGCFQFRYVPSISVLCKSSWCWWKVWVICSTHHRAVWSLGLSAHFLLTVFIHSFLQRIT